MSESLGVTYDEILAEIDRLTAASPEGFTILEMMDATGHCDNWCRDKIRRLINAGRVRYNGKAKREAIDGKPCLVPVYIYVSGGADEND